MDNESVDQKAMNGAAKASKRAKKEKPSAEDAPHTASETKEALAENLPTKPKYERIPDATKDIIRVTLEEVFADEEWNSRRHFDHALEVNPEECDELETDGMSDYDLEVSIRARGVVTPVKVRLLSEAEREALAKKKPANKYKFFLVYGFRRYRTLMKLAGPEAMISAVLQMDFGNEKDNDVASRIDNLVENINRRNLLPYEKADAFHALLSQHTTYSAGTIADATGLSKSYVNNLVRVRRKLCPELWEEYKRKGEAMRLDDLVKVCSLPKGEQVAAYEAERERKRGGRPAGKETATKPKPIDFVEKLIRSASAKSKEAKTKSMKAFLEGMKAGGRAVRAAMADGELTLNWDDILEDID